MQELRVASIGVQVLFGFLLALPFTTQFSRLSNAQQVLYTADLVLAAIAAALFTSPVVHHRLTFRHHRKKSLLRFANVTALAGLVAVGLTISGVVLLVVSFVWDDLAVWLIAMPIALIILALWLAVPFLYHPRDDY
jgi:putative flippase GtrA